MSFQHILSGSIREGNGTKIRQMPKFKALIKKIYDRAAHINTDYYRCRYRIASKINISIVLKLNGNASQILRSESKVCGRCRYSCACRVVLQILPGKL